MGSGGFNLIGTGVRAGGALWPLAIAVPAALIMGAAHAYAGAFSRFKDNTAESDVIKSIFGPWASGVGAGSILMYNIASIVVILVFCSKMLLPSGSWIAQVGLAIALLAAMAALSLYGIDADRIVIDGIAGCLIGMLVAAFLLGLWGLGIRGLPTLQWPASGGFMNSLWIFFFVLAGFDANMKFAEEAADPADIPRSFYTSNMISILLTFGVAAAIAIWLPGLTAAQGETAFSQLFAVFMGPWIMEPFKWLVVIFLLLTTFVVFLATSRYLYGLGDQTEWLAFTTQVNGASAPWASILTVFGAGSILSLLNNTELLVKVTDIGFAVIAALVASAVSVADVNEGRLASAAVNGASENHSVTLCSSS
jgi:ABC-type cobalt transport system substrate-binding protein